jgi:hypothetical protein
VRLSLYDSEGALLASNAAKLANGSGNWAGVVAVPANTGAGSDFVTAQCSGPNYRIQDYNYVALTVTSAPAVATTTTLTSSANPSRFSQPVSFAATVAAQDGSGTPTGAVTFADGPTTLGTVNLTGGVAQLTTSNLPVGSHGITATYVGNSRTSSANLTQSVQKAATALTAAPVRKVPNATFSATLISAYGPVANQSVLFTVANGLGGTRSMCAATTNTNGIATCTASNTKMQLSFVSNYNAAFAGSTGYLASSAKGKLT